MYKRWSKAIIYSDPSVFSMSLAHSMLLLLFETKMSSSSSLLCHHLPPYFSPPLPFLCPPPPLTQNSLLIFCCLGRVVIQVCCCCFSYFTSLFVTPAISLFFLSPVKEERDEEGIVESGLSPEKRGKKKKGPLGH